MTIGLTIFGSIHLISSELKENFVMLPYKSYIQNPLHLVVDDPVDAPCSSHDLVE